MTRKTTFILLAGAALAAVWALPVGTAAAAPAGSAFATGQTSGTDAIAMEMQRRGGRGGGGFRGGRGGGGGGAAAAAIGIGVIGAIIASEAARANARRECWIERRRVHDDWGRPIGVRRVRVCR